MRPKLIGIAIILVVILSCLGAAKDVFTRCECTGECQGLEVNSSSVMRDSGKDKECCSRCLILWGKYCGGIANASSNCFEFPPRFKCDDKGKILSGDKSGLFGGCGKYCEEDPDTDTCWPKTMPPHTQDCKSWCSGLSFGALYSCLYACENACWTNEWMNFAVYILVAISALIVAVMIVYHGARLLLSKDLVGREESKKSIQYAIIALLILVLVFFIIKLLVFPVQAPGGINVQPVCV